LGSVKTTDQITDPVDYFGTTVDTLRRYTCAKAYQLALYALCAGAHRSHHRFLQ
jgi:hypothetical protein